MIAGFRWGIEFDDDVGSSERSVGGEFQVDVAVVGDDHLGTVTDQAGASHGEGRPEPRRGSRGMLARSSRRRRFEGLRQTLVDLAFACL